MKCQTLRVSAGTLTVDHGAFHPKLSSKFRGVEEVNDFTRVPIHESLAHASHSLSVSPSSPPPPPSRRDHSSKRGKTEAASEAHLFLVGRDRIFGTKRREGGKGVIVIEGEKKIVVVVGAVGTVEKDFSLFSFGIGDLLVLVRKYLEMVVCGNGRRSKTAFYKIISWFLILYVAKPHGRVWVGILSN